MADASEDTDAEKGGDEASAKRGGSPIPFLVVGVLGVALGIAVPFLLPTSAEAPEEKPDPKPIPTQDIPEEESIYLPFSENSIVVNLDGERMTRFLSISFFMKVAKGSEADILKSLEAKTPPLKSWLITHLSAYSLEDIRGPAGQNRVKREIRDEFNTILFPDGGDRIFAILFSEFAVQ